MPTRNMQPETFLIPSLYPQEHGHTYYTVTKEGRKYTCNCWGLQRLAGHRKSGEPFYRNVQCDHIKEAQLKLSS